MDIDFDRLENFDIQGVDPKDYPDFCDAYVAFCEIDGRSATDVELEYINEEFREQIQCMAMEHCVGLADFMG